MEKEKALEFLKRIGVKNEIKEIKSFCVIYENKCCKSYSIITDIGEIMFRVLQLEDGTYSKLDYFNTAYQFDRNVNLMCKF